LKDLNIVRRITREMIEDWNKLNCMYLEIRTSLKSINGTTKEDYLRTVLEEIYLSNQKNEMKTRLIISLIREYSLEDYLNTLEVYKNFNDEKLKPLIVGIDYAGNENKELHKYDEVIPIFQQFRELGLSVTIHMGEIKNYQKLDLKKFRPDRVSHTYYYNNSDKLEIMRNKIPIECCPTGSFCEEELTSYKDITFKHYYKTKIQDDNDEFVYDLYTIITDDTMLFGTDISQEYFEVVQNFHLTKEDLKDLISRSIDFIFEKDEQFRDKLRNKIKSFKI
jgi:adenosine deaminase